MEPGGSGSWALTAQERGAYTRDGFFVRPSVFREDELESLREAAERAVEQVNRAAAGATPSYEIDGNRYSEAAGATVQFEHQPGSTTVRVIEPFHHLDERFDRLVDDPRFVEPACGLVDSERVSLFTAKLNLKRPREGSRFRWHQDSPYWNHATPHVDRLPNIMLALDDADADNGCLRVIRGSHRQGLLPGLEGQGRLGPLFTDPRYFDEADQVPAEMLGGSLLFFDPHTVHGSQPNTSGRRRRALLFTYQPSGHRMFKVNQERRAG